MKFAGGPLDARLHAAARQLLDAGGISNVRILQNGRVVTGIVPPHRVYLRYGQPDAASGEAALEGECSCGARSPCLHVAAVALAAAGHPKEQPANPRRDADATELPPSQQGLCYVLEDIDDVCRLSVWVAQAGAGSSGLLQSAQPFALRPTEPGDGYPRYVEAADRLILEALPRQQDAKWSLQDCAGFRLLRQIIATGRCRWDAPHGATLRSGPGRELRLEWQAASNGGQRLCWAGDECIHVLAGVEPAVYVDTMKRECGTLQIPYDLALLRRYWNQPALAPEQVAAVIDWLAGQAHAEDFPRPAPLVVRRQPLAALGGNLTLSAGPASTLNFVYNGHLVAGGGLRMKDDAVRHLDGDVHEIGRDRDAEHRLHQELDAVMPDAPRTRDAWLRFMVDGIPRLACLGWSITIEPEFPYRLAPAADWYAELASAPGAANRETGWFDLRLGIVVDGRPMNLLPALIEYLHATSEPCTSASLLKASASLLEVEHLFVPLEDGRHLPVPTSRLRRIAETLVELYDREALNERLALTLPVEQIGRLALLGKDAGAPALRSDDPALLALINEIGDFDGIEPLPAPPDCRATLRRYQQEGLGWLQFLRRYRLSGILADDMGLGKTVQILAHLTIEKAQGRLRNSVLIVAPVSVIGNWQQEARRFTPTLTTVVLHGPKRHRLLSTLDHFDIIITGYPSLLFDGDLLLRREFSIVILDEAQTIKNPHARVSQAARGLRAEHRLCLTGTPMENHLGDLWSLCEFVQPGLLGTEKSFQRQYRTPIEKEGNARRAEALRRRIAPILLRRTKDGVARELPPRTHIVEAIMLEEQQRDLYDAIRLSMHRRVREAIEQQGFARSRIIMLEALLKLRQACCDPRLVTADGKLLPAHGPRSGHSQLSADGQLSVNGRQPAELPSAKLDWLSTALPELIEDGRRILLFSQFTSMLRLIEVLVARLSIPYCLLTGETRDRSAVVERFQSGVVPLFLLSLKAGGAGLNLTAADTVIHYDPWWNPAVEAQATDRAHRIGQDKPVFIYKLIAQGTVEEKILKLQADKHALVSQLYTAGGAVPSRLTSEDLARLFAP